MLYTQSGCGQSNSKEPEKMNIEKSNMSDAEWKSKLTPSQYYILREKGTEKPFSGEFVFTKDKGVYKSGAV